MATIIKNVLKGGVSYRIQVPITQLSGKQKTYSTTWRPPGGMTDAQAKKEVLQVALDFEKKLRVSDNLDDRNIRFSEYSQRWLETCAENNSLAHLVRSKRSLTEINAVIGHYTLTELTPSIIQRYLDSLKKRKRQTMRAKPTGLAEFMTENKISAVRLGKRSGISSRTALSARNGSNITLKNAELIAKAVGKRFSELFEKVIDDRPLAKETISKYRQTIRTILGMAKRQRLVDDNYASSDYILPVKSEETEIDCFDNDKARHFFDFLIDEPDIRKKTALLILLFMGLRRSELCGLEWRDIDFNRNRMMIVRASLYFADYGIITKKTKSRASKRNLAIPSSLTEVLKEYREWMLTQQEQYGDRWVSSDRLFCQENGSPINPSTIGRWFRKILDKAGLEHYTLHSLRHTNITLQLIAGVPPKTVSARAGHSRSTQTLNRYSHFIQESDEQAAEILNNLLTKNTI